MKNKALYRLIKEECEDVFTNKNKKASLAPVSEEFEPERKKSFDENRCNDVASKVLKIARDKLPKIQVGLKRESTSKPLMSNGSLSYYYPVKDGTENDNDFFLDLYLGDFEGRPNPRVLWVCLTHGDKSVAAVDKTTAPTRLGTKAPGSSYSHDEKTEKGCLKFISSESNFEIAAKVAEEVMKIIPFGK